MEKQANKLGRGQMQYLRLRIEQGATNADILSDSALQNLTPENLRCIRSRYKKKQEATYALLKLSFLKIPGAVQSLLT